MRFAIAGSTALALICWSTFPAVACLWDSDTLEQEQSQFPGTLELVLGKFPRHTKAFYEWRAKDREAKLAAVGEDQRDPRLVDDLAVSYDKLGRRSEAIALMEAELQRQPGRYETLANLGTFYIHNGELEKGVEFIAKAIEVNPDAHFGREIYQQLLVQYLLLRKEQGQKKLPMARDGKGFAEFVLEMRKDMVAEGKEREEIAAATQGVLGMMRFGNHDSPVLLEALGDLLTFQPKGGSHKDLNAIPRNLAARVYLKAAYEAGDDEEVADAYRRSADRVSTLVLSNNKPLQLRTLEIEFKKELKDAENWYRILERREAKWIRDSKDPEAEFRAAYFTNEGTEPDSVDSGKR